ncbi:GntR family transcriptional regulator [Serpentinicella alkaliphila]|uniref:DNA-binding transcriptional regulator YhcF (GntR family) n=1 Tax=Serpentinicella alkaliphila TaxID=1734049 RepID=A0A4R2TRE2_9FIRM|nr:GntR family transcriptional regulator [Serpentinicella alkaliphila]QUH26374.1 GntR family transcriptional regulator [Serpentinicella alkaliphila]TCP97602.1 DNA-binding transcriptional regulator YhcF (GntR family) [Serpentinicella alkaliphila]
MQIKFDSVKPIYVQIAEAIEDEIITGNLKEGQQCYSQLIISRELNVNPATAAKGINLLVTEGILLKQRGLAMIVANGAREQILEKRKTEGFDALGRELVNEAKKLGLKYEQVIEIIKRYF